MKTKTIEQFLIDNQNEFGLSGSRFVLVVSSQQDDKGVTVYIHPEGRNGETIDGDFIGDTFIQKYAE